MRKMIPPRHLLVFIWWWVFQNNFRWARALQGDSYCGSTMCVRAFLNGTQVTYQMAASLGESQFGWMAIGFGSAMTDAAMVIMWPNHDGSVTLSQRAASGHAQPYVVSNPPRIATKYLQLSSQTSSETELAFTVNHDGQNIQHLVWAIATSRPPSGAVDAQIRQHVASGAISLDLSRQFADNTLGTAAPTGPPGGTYLPPFPTGGTSGNPHGFELPPLLPYQKMLMAHAILCGIGFLIVLPTGALVARWARSFTNTWFRAHWIIQAGIGIPIIVSGWFLGVAGVITKEGRHFDDIHKVLGLALIGAYVLQLLLGVHIHFFKPRGGMRPRAMPSGGKEPNVLKLVAASTRPFLNYVHPILGLLIIAFAFYQVWIGINVQWELATGRGEAPPVTMRLWIAWVVILPCAYFFGLALLPRQLKKERKDAQMKARGSDAVPLKASPTTTTPKRSLRGLKISSPVPIKEEEEWKRDEPIEPSSTQEMFSDDGHHSMRPVQNSRPF